MFAFLGFLVFFGALALVGYGIYRVIVERKAININVNGAGISVKPNENFGKTENR